MGRVAVGGVMPGLGSEDGLRNALVDRLVAAGALRDGRVAQSFGTVPRHLFLPGVPPERAYRDEAVPTKWGPDGRPVSSSSQPAVMAMMLEQLDVRRGQRVLEVGAGTGYNAALLAALVGPSGEVTTVDLDEDLVGQARSNLAAAGVDGVRVVCADGAGGWPDRAPYDRIILTVGAWDLAPAWTEQLAAGGRLLLPLSLRGVQRSVAFEPAADHLSSVSVLPCGFMLLRGAMAGPEPRRPLGPGSGVFLEFDGERRLDVGALYAALGQPGDLVLTGVHVTADEVIDGLALSLALHEPDAGRLYAAGATADRDLVPPLLTAPGMAATGVLVGERVLAALVRPSQHPDQHTEHTARSGAFQLGVRAFGVGGGELTGRLVDAVRRWDAGGRPATAGMRIRAYPAGSALEGDGAALLDKHYTRLLLDWP